MTRTVCSAALPSTTCSTECYLLAGANDDGRSAHEAPRRPHPEAFGQFSEAIARFIGTARFLVWQTMFIVIWLFINKFVKAFDGKQLQLLTLLLSLQAAYAAPLILLAQNRTESRDRATTERDRAITERTQADTEYLARELASVRLALSDMVTGADLTELTNAVAKLTERIEAVDS
jgi:uncharacterized membrane protein